MVYIVIAVVAAYHTTKRFLVGAYAFIASSLYKKILLGIKIGHVLLQTRLTQTELAEKCFSESSRP